MPALRALLPLLASLSLWSTPGAAEVWESLGPPGSTSYAVVVDPDVSDTVYMGTYTGGVWKSVDGGAIWQATGRGPDATYSIVIDPSAPSTLYATVYQDIYRSLDGGDTWGPLFPGFDNGETVWALAIDPGTPTTLYAGAASFVDAPTGGVAKSVDGGATWVRSNDGLTSLAVYALAIDPQHPNTLYAGTDDGVFATADGGTTWALAGTGAAHEVKALVVDPITPTVVWAGTETGVFRSGDAGGTWQLVSGTSITDGVWTLALDPVNRTTVYAGTHAAGIWKSTDGGASWTRLAGSPNSRQVAIDPAHPTTLYSVHEEGTFKTENGGATWARSEAGLRGNDITSLAADPRLPGTFYGANYHAMFTTHDDGATWTHALVPTSDSFVLAFDPRRHVLVLGTHAFGATVASYASRRGGERWAKARGLATEQANALAVAPSDTRTMYAATFDGVFKSRNSGRVWKATPTMPAQLIVLDVAVDPTSPDTVYAATSPGAVYKTNDSGATWASILPGVDGLVMGRLAIDARDGSRVYAASIYHPRVFHSIDGGATWSEGSSGLPPTPEYSSITALLVDPLESSVVYAGVSVSGIFRSTDGGATWAEFNPGMTAQKVMQLIAGPGSVVYAGTSHGLYRLDTQ